MPKWLWVLLPAILFAAVVGVRLALRRPMARALFNAWSSMLLLAYLLGTAGLGIFWVANQQLPVFDWHYLFGYATLLLVVLHLALNLPSAWRTIVRSRGRAAPSRPATAPADSPGARWRAAGDSPGAHRRAAVVGFVVGVAASAGAFLLWRWPAAREERRDAASSTPRSRPGAVDLSADKTAARAAIERFHVQSSHSRAGVLARAPALAWRTPSPSSKRIEGAPRIALRGARAVADALPRPRLDREGLSVVLWHTAGVTAERGGLRLRASPSSGALFSTELYVVARDDDGLPAAVWHYDAEAHALERAGSVGPGFAYPGAAPPMLAASGDGLWMLAGAGDAPALVVATAVFARTGHKYRERTYRYVLADLGHALENLRVAAAAVGAPATFAAAFDEAQVAAVLGIDEREEGVLAVAVLGASADGDRAATDATAAAQAFAPAALDLGPAGGDASVAVTVAAHAATSLRRHRGGESMISPTTSERRSLHDPPGSPHALQRIAARRSQRRFLGAPVPLATLEAVLAAADGAPPLLSPAVRIYVVAHRVGGLAPGAYRRDAARRALAATRAAADLRADARAAALDQDVIGDAAFVLVLAIDRSVVASDPLGPGRGYRHAFLEAGMVGERVYLDAAERGCGVCAVGAFFDDEATRLVDADPAREWIVHFVGIGAVEAGRASASGATDRIGGSLPA